MKPEAQLAGKTIICTFPPTNSDFTDAIAPTGIKTVWLPTIEIISIDFRTPQPLEQYHWLVFTSKNGVKAFFERAHPLPHQQIAVLGSSTAKALVSHGHKAAFVGSGTSGMTFADELENVIAPNQNVLMLLGNLAPNAIGDKLRHMAHIDRVDVYETAMPKEINASTLEMVKNQIYDVMLVASPSSIDNLAALLGTPLPVIKAIAIGSTTATAMRKLGIEPIAVSTEQTYLGLAQTAIDYLSGPSTHHP